MARIQAFASTMLALGARNVLRVLAYRLGLALRTHPVLRLKAKCPQGSFFALPPGNDGSIGQTISVAVFGHRRISFGEAAPSWLSNPLSSAAMPEPLRPWWKIPDFDPAVGDIKLIWELSRMGWAPLLAQRASRGNRGAVEQLNHWLADWCASNPPYIGPNWKCGQEASLRVINIAVAALVLQQANRPSSALLEFVRAHLRRILPTVRYAIAQDNNHGTSEAAALFVGGSWLAAAGDPQGRKWCEVGRHWLEDRAARLIGPLGSFSQYSLNYHRLMLDTLSIAEVWRRKFGLPPFSPTFRWKAEAAAEWLRHMLASAGGDGPNVGGNDGAQLLQFSGAAYRDFRPSVQLAMALFANKRAYVPDGPWNEASEYLGVPLPETVADPVCSRVADDGGFAMLRKGSAYALLRYPRFGFRPSQADALHLDFWVRDVNVLRDAGTFSYGAESNWLDYFAGARGHNTVQFDHREQMERVGRFLFSRWLKTDLCEEFIEDEDRVSFGAAYSDCRGARHRRSVFLSASALSVTDEVAGFKQVAVLRWRLLPGKWMPGKSPEGYRITHEDGYVLAVHGDIPLRRCAVVEGWESLHYLDKTPLPVLEVEVDQPGTLTTTLRWTP